MACCFPGFIHVCSRGLPTHCTALHRCHPPPPPHAAHPTLHTDNPNRPIYNKGLVAEVSKFLFGEGFAITGGEQWRVRRKAVGPSLHRWVRCRGWVGAEGGQVCSS